MALDATILRLIMSQVFSVVYLLLLIPLKPPKKRHYQLFIGFAILIVMSNALMIHYVGLTFYIRFYFLTLVLPYVLLLYYLAVYKSAKLIFALLSVQVISNVGIINGLLTSYLLYGENHPGADTVARMITYLVFLPVLIKFIRPTYLTMVNMLEKGWWILNLSLMLSYLLLYFTLFVPGTIFDRPTHFFHAYIGMLLSLTIYGVIFFLFVEIQSKMTVEEDKRLLTTKITTLAEESAKISTMAYKDTLTGIKNRYSLFNQIELYIEKAQPFCVLFMDLNNLKSINDTYSHSKGDDYIKAFALALKNITKDQGDVYRFAGDEFVCLLTRDFNPFDQAAFKQKITGLIDLDVPYHGMSLGMACYPQDALHSEALIAIADHAMYKDKDTQRQSKRS